MRVLTEHQPVASLISIGVVSILPRSWPTQARGPLAIHAAARRMPLYGEDGLHLWYLAGHHCNNDLGNDGFWGPVRYQWGTFPLGAIVATCTLIDVVPIVNLGEQTVVRRIEVGTMGGEPNLMLCAPDPGCEVITDFDRLVGFNLAPGDADPESGVDFDASDYYERDVTDQLPYGLWEPGRYAYLLADIVPVDPPVPFRGGQGLSRTWEP